MSSPPQHGTTPLGIRAWRGPFAIALGAFALVITEFLPVGLLPEISHDLGVSEGTTGLAVTATALLGMLAAPAATIMVGRLDRRIALLGLTVLLVISAVMSALAGDFALLIVARVILGIGVGGFWAMSITAAGGLVPPEKVAAASSLVLGGISIASVVSVPAGSYIGAHVDWHWAFAAAAVLAVIVLLAQLVMLPSIPMEQKVDVGSFLGVLRPAKTRAILLTTILVIAGHYVVYTYVTPLLQQVAGFSDNAASILLLVFGVVTVVGNFLGGAMAARAVHRTVIITVVLFAGSILVLAATGSVAVAAVIALIIWALAFGMAPVSTQLWMYDASRHHPEAAQAMFTSLFQLSIGLGSLVGSLTVNTGGVRTSAWVATAFLGVAVVVAVLARWIHSDAAPVPDQRRLPEQATLH